MVLEYCTEMLTGDVANREPLSEEKKRNIHKQFTHESNVLAYAQATVTLDNDTHPRDMSLDDARVLMEEAMQVCFDHSLLSFFFSFFLFFYLCEKGSAFVGCVVMKDTPQPSLKTLVRRLTDVGVKVKLAN